MTQRKSLCAAAVALALVSGSAFATNGYFAHGYGTKNKGMAGAGVALPQDAMTAATNPAGMASVGNRMDFGAAVFSPLRSYTADTPTGANGFVPGTGIGLVNGNGTTVDSERDLFLVPHFAYNTMLTATTSLGVAVYGNGGMNTFYRDTDTPGGFGTFGGPGGGPGIPIPAGNTGVDLMQLFIAPTYAMKVNDKVSIGVSAILAYQRFKAHGLINYSGLSNDAPNLTENDYDDSYGAGAKIGILAELNDRVSVGASYQSRIYMSEFDKYAGLFAEQGDFDIPSNFTIGAAFKATPKLTVTADVQHIMYSEVDSIANPISPNIVTCATRVTLTDPSCLGGDNGIGFGWDDMTIYKLGLQWEYSSDLTLRAGFSHAKQPIPSSEVIFNIIAPAVVENHFTLGGTQQLSKDSELSVSALYAPEKKLAGNPTGEQDVELKMHQFELEVSYGMTW